MSGSGIPFNFPHKEQENQKVASTTPHFAKIFKIIMPFMVVIIGIGCFATCNNMSKILPSPHHSKLEKVNHNINYYYDQRTNLCFARANLYVFNSEQTIINLTYVPCTPEVDKLVLPWPEFNE